MPAYASLGPSGSICGSEVSVIRQLRDKDNYLIFSRLLEKVYITADIISIAVADCEIQSTLMFLGLWDQWALLEGSLLLCHTQAFRYYKDDLTFVDCDFSLSDERNVREVEVKTRRL